jgi:hypothetical protein
MFDESVINPQWFSSRKPYKNKAAYDLYYVKICRKIFHLLTMQSLKYHAPLNMYQCRDLAYILTSYFEDMVNQIGFWDAVVREHQVIFGQRVPFFTKAQLKEWEDCEDINPADIHYLIFVYMVFLQNSVGISSFPAESFFTELRDQVFECLDEIEDVVLTDFYKDYLLPEPTYIDFKRMLTWFVYEGYLFGHEFTYLRNQIDTSMRKQVPKDMEQGLYDTHLFAELEKEMYTANSCLSGLFPMDVLADSLKADADTTAKLKGTKHLINGVFEYTSMDQRNYHFKHTLTGEIFPVRRNAVPALESVLGLKKHWLTNLYRWDDSHIILGICGHEPDEDIVSWHNKQNEHDYKKHNGKFQAVLKDFLEESAADALAFFQTNPVIFKTYADLNQKMTDFYQWQFLQDVRNGKAKPDRGGPTPFRGDHLGDMEDIALFIYKDESPVMIQNYFDHLSRMTTIDTVYEFCERELFIKSSIPAKVYLSLRREASTSDNTSKNEWGITKDNDFEALLRTYMPGEFSPLRKPKVILPLPGFKDIRL